jgi:hypothetical protein
MFGDDEEIDPKTVMVPVGDWDMFSRDTRIAVHDYVMGQMSKNAKQPYEPIIDPNQKGLQHIDVPPEIEEELNGILPLSEVVRVCKKCFLFKDNEWFMNERMYVKAINLLNEEYLGRTFSKMVDQGLAEMCCDKGEILYRLTPKGKNKKGI